MIEPILITYGKDVTTSNNLWNNEDNLRRNQLKHRDTQGEKHVAGQNVGKGPDTRGFMKIGIPPIFI
jgi:hypothetical protein